MEGNKTYISGYIGVIDVLGFGAFSNELANFDNIKAMMEDIICCKNTFEKIFKHVKFSILSDTVVVMIKEDYKQIGDYALFDSILRAIGMIRTFVLDNTGLYSRAAITFGYYYYNEKNNVIFGPAVTHCAKLAEAADEYITIDSRFDNRPAAILVDDVFSVQGNNPFYNSFQHGGVTSHLSTLSLRRELRQVVGADYYIYNPYFDAFENYKLSKKTKETSDDILLESFCKREKDRLQKQLEGDHAEKFNIEEEMFQDFLNSIGENKAVVIL